MEYIFSIYGGPSLYSILHTYYFFKKIKKTRCLHLGFGKVLYRVRFGANHN